MKILKGSPGRRGCEGSILFASLALLAVAAIGMGSLVSSVQSELRTTRRGLQWKTALPIAEAGVEEALAHLNSGLPLTNNGWSFDATRKIYWKQRNAGEGYFVVEFTPPATNQTPVIRSTGFMLAPLQTTNWLSRTVEVGTRISKAAGIEVKDTFKGSADRIMDSFDSSDPAASTNGQYDPAKARDNCSISTISGIPGKIDVGNRKVHGKVAVGSGGSVTLSSQGKVGSKAWIARSDTGGKIEPGRFASGFSTTFPDVIPPFRTGLAPMPGVWGGTSYAYILGNGDYAVANFKLSSSQQALVLGNARLFVSSDFDMSANSALVIAPGARIDIYTDCPKITANGKGFINYNGVARNLRLYATSKTTSISLAGSADFIGWIYAPNADIKLTGGSTYMGHVKAKSVDMGGSNAFHADEDVGTVTFRVVSWKEL